MENILLLFFCMLLGIVFQKIKSFPSNAYLTLNSFVIYVSLPAVTLIYIPKLTLDIDLWMPISTAWIIFIVAFVFFKLFQKIFYYSHATLACLVLTCGLFNSSFIGFPLIKALYGNEGLQIAIMVDQPGSFMVLCTLGIALATYYSSGKNDVSTMVRKIISFPPFWGFVIAFLVKFFNYQYAETIQSILQIFANTLTPLALISVGLQLKLEKEKLFAKELYLGLAYKLMIAPALLFFIFILLLKEKNLISQVSIMEGAMAPMITAAIIAIQYNLDKKLASIIIGIGIPLSFVSLYFWYWLLNQFI